jgi:methanogenic corrinoid protein MtbC1
MSQLEQPGDALPELGPLVADLEEDEALEVVRQRMARGDDPLQIIDDCQTGMRLVGERYAQQRYFLSALIRAGEILRQIMDIVLPDMGVAPTEHTSGRILVGTVRGDIHDLGKNLLIMLLRSHGFAVMDLGIDVAPETFVEEARRFRPHVIGLSGLITAAFATMRETASALRAMMAEDGVRIPVILGGQVDEQVCRYVGADYWTTDAMEGVRLCEQIAAEAQGGPN